MESLVFGILVSIQKIFVRSESQFPDFRAFKIAYVQTIVRSKLHMSRLSCVQNCICPDYRAFIFFSRPCNVERTTPPCAFMWVWTYPLSVWDLNLGRHDSESDHDKYKAAKRTLQSRSLRFLFTEKNEYLGVSAKRRSKSWVTLCRAQPRLGDLLAGETNNLGFLGI